MRARRRAAFAALCLIATFPAQAADPFYVGTWKFTGAVAAPWIEAGREPDGKQSARLMGKTVVIKAKAISGPSPFACKQPKYAMKDVPPEGLFQGAFDEMKRRDKNVESAKLASALGFTTTIKTLATGCAIDFHFADETTAQAALDNVIYTLKKQKR